MLNVLAVDSFEHFVNRLREFLRDLSIVDPSCTEIELEFFLRCSTQKLSIDEMNVWTRFLNKLFQHQDVNQLFPHHDIFKSTNFYLNSEQVKFLKVNAIELEYNDLLAKIEHDFLVELNNVTRLIIFIAKQSNILISVVKLPLFKDSFQYELLELFDKAYWDSLKKFNTQKLNLNLQAQKIKLADFALESKIPTLAVSIEVEQDIKVFSQEKPNIYGYQRNYLAVPNIIPKEHLLNSSSIFMQFSRILYVLGVDALKFEVYLGNDGLINLFSQFKRFAYDDFKSLMKAFFLNGSFSQESNIQFLVRPEGQQLLERCLNWSSSFFKFFLLAINQDNDSERSFYQVVVAADDLWLLIQNYNVFIPHLDECKTKNFMSCIQGMIELLKKTDKEWWSLQINHMFQLDWTLPDNILFLKEQGCQFVTTSVLDDDFEKYAAQYLREKGSDIYQYFLHFKSFKNIENENLLKLLLQAPHFKKTVDHIENFLLLINLYQLDISKLVQIVSSSKNNLNINVMMKMLQLAKTDFFIFWEMFCRWLELSKTEQAIEHWEIFIQLLAKQEKNFFIQKINDFIFDECYEVNFFKLLCLAILDDFEPSITFFNLFKAKDSSVQKILLDVLSTIEDGALITQIKLESLLKQPLKTDTILECLTTYCPQIKFSYFNQIPDYQKQVFNLILSLIRKIHNTLSILVDKDYRIPNALNFTYYGCLRNEMIEKIKFQLSLIELVETTFLSQKGSLVNFEEIIPAFKEMDVFFIDFLNKRLDLVLNKAVLGTLALLTFNHISSASSVRSLLEYIVDNYANFQKFVGDIFEPKILSVLKNSAHSQSLLDVFLKYLLFENIEKNIILNLSNMICHQDIKAISLKDFIGTPEFTASSLEAYFQRIDAIIQVSRDWHLYESQWIQFGLDPVQIWQICTRYQTQLDVGFQIQPSVSIYWKVCFNWFDMILRQHTLLNTTPTFDVYHFLERVLEKRQLYPKQLFHLDGNIIPEWLALSQQIESWLKDPVIRQHPAFITLITLTFSEQLQYQRSVDTEMIIGFFDRIGEKNKKILPNIISLLNASNQETVLHVEKFINLLSALFQKKNSVLWLRLIKQLLQNVNKEIEQEIQHINIILEWLDKSDFDWLSILVEGNDWTFSDLKKFYEILSTLDAVWLLKKPAVSDFKSKQPMAPKARKTFLNSLMHKTRSLGSWLSPFPTEFDWENFPESKTFNKVEDPSFEFVKMAWEIFKRPMYPSIKQLMDWFSQMPLDVKQEILDFDRHPYPRIQYVDFPNYEQLDFDRWFKELKFYDKQFSLRQTTHLQNRLKEILVEMRKNEASTRSELLEQLQFCRNKLLQRQDKNLENRLVGILAELYRKVTLLRPYPVQILFLLVNLINDGRNLIVEVDTGEGKALNIAILAALKWLRREQNTVIVLTANNDLIEQDFFIKKHFHFFKLLNIPVDIKKSILTKDSPLDDYQPGGIYYSTALDLSIFLQRREVKGCHYSLLNNVDIILDEVDKALLDQNYFMNLVTPNLDLKDLFWVYPLINQFVDGYYDNSQAMFSVEQWTNLCRESILQEQGKNILRIQQINKISSDKWQRWLSSAVYAKNLKENIDFVVEQHYSEMGLGYQTVPYLHGELRSGYQLSYMGFEAVPQFLHARLNHVDRPFIQRPETKLLSQISAFDLRFASSIVGLSGSIGQLQEFLNFKALIQPSFVRIGRHHKKSLQELTPLLVNHLKDLEDYLLEIIQKKSQPILIVCQEIYEAESIYYALMKTQLANKYLHLITDKQSKEVRGEWLYASETQKYAGGKNCVTISTNICGTGTDIKTTHPEGLLVIAAGVLTSRRKVQVKGRAARAGHKGSFQSIYIHEKLNAQATFFQMRDKLPRLARESLPHWELQIQKMMTSGFQQYHQILLLKSWGQHHLKHYLDQALMVGQLSEEQSIQFHIWLNVQFEKHWPNHMLTHVDTKIVYHVLDILVKIWQDLLSYFNFYGFKQIQFIFSEHCLKDSLMDDIENWQLITDLQFQNKGFFVNKKLYQILEENSPAMILTEPIFPAHGIQVLKEQLNHNILHAHFSSWYSFLLAPFIFIWNWLNPALVKLECYIEDAWEIFLKDPCVENWSHFYQTILMSTTFYQQFKKSHFFGVFNDSKWQGLLDLVYFIDDLFIHFFGKNIHKLENTLNELAEQLVTLKFNSYFLWIMTWFFPNQLQIHHESEKILCEFQKDPSVENLTVLIKQLLWIRTKIMMSSHQWFVWYPFLKQWLQLEQKILQWQALHMPFSTGFLSWVNLQKNESNQRLSFFGHLICQEQLQCSYTFYTDQYLSDLNQMFHLLVENDLDSKLVLYELGRFFSSELIAIFLNSQGHMTHDYEEKNMPHEHVFALVKDVLTYVLKHPKVILSKQSLFWMDSRLQVLNNELQQLLNHRDLQCYIQTTGTL